MTTPNKERFGRWLKWVRENYPLTQDELAERIGTKKAHVSKMERGKLLPPLNVLDRVTRVLGVSFRTPLIELEYLKETVSDAEVEDLLSRYSALSPKYKEIAGEIFTTLWTHSTGDGHKNGEDDSSDKQPPNGDSIAAKRGTKKRLPRVEDVVTPDKPSHGARKKKHR